MKRRFIALIGAISAWIISMLKYRIIMVKTEAFPLIVSALNSRCRAQRQSIGKEIFKVAEVTSCYHKDHAEKQLIIITFGRDMKVEINEGEQR